MGDLAVTHILNLVKEIAAKLISLESLQKNDRYGLAPQMQRAVSHIISGVPKGLALKSAVEQSAALENAFSTLRELHYQIGLAYRLGYIDEEYHGYCDYRADEARKMLAGCIAELRLEAFHDTAKGKSSLSQVRVVPVG